MSLNFFIPISEVVVLVVVEVVDCGVDDFFDDLFWS